MLVVRYLFRILCIYAPEAGCVLKRVCGAGGGEEGGTDWEDAGRWLEPSAPGATAAMRTALEALAARTAIQPLPCSALCPSCNNHTGRH